MATLGLCIITREYDDNIRRILKDYSRYFDEIYLQINGGGPLPKASPHLHISTYKWNDDFAAARNALLKHVKTDYWMWLDSDDEILYPEKLVHVVNVAEKTQHDLINLPYLTVVNKSGEVEAMHWRERVLRTSHPFKWHEPVHEIVQSSASHSRASLVEAVAIKHAFKTAEETLASVRRNHIILEKQYQSGNRRTTSLFYLANSYAMLQDIPVAIKLLKLVTQSKNPTESELVYDAWLNLAALQRKIGELEASNQSYKHAIKLQPNQPDAYLSIGNAYLDAGQPAQAIEWLSQGLTKELQPQSRATNPVFLTVTSRTMLAEAYSQTGEHVKAMQWIEEAAAMNPANPEFTQTYQRILQKYTENKVATLGLCIITREYDDNIRRILKDYSRYFDEIYLQINGGGPLPKASPHLHVSTYKWNDDFAAARNALLKHVKTDYWMWLDNDDEILHPEKLSEVMDFAEKGHLDLVYLPYIWQVNQSGEVEAMHWRERVLRSSHPFKWHEPVHEIVQSSASPRSARMGQAAAIKHASKTTEKTLASARRNLKILERQYSSGDRRAMLLNYLATTYAMIQDYTAAIKFFKLVTQAKDDLNAEVVYDAWLKLAAYQRHIGELEACFKSYQDAIKYQPDWPDAYLYLGGTYLKSGRPLEAIEWLNLGLTKKVTPVARPTDPAFLNIGSRTMLAEAYSQIGEQAKAKQMIEEAASMGPTNPDFAQTYQRILKEYAGSILLKRKS